MENGPSLQKIATVIGATGREPERTTRLSRTGGNIVLNFASTSEFGQRMLEKAKWKGFQLVAQTDCSVEFGGKPHVDGDNGARRSRPGPCIREGFGELYWTIHR